MIPAHRLVRTPRRPFLLSLSFRAATSTAAFLLLVGCGGSGAGAAEPATAAASPLTTSPPSTPPGATPVVVAAPTITLRAFASGYGSSAAQLQLRSNGIIVATFEVRATTAFDHALPLSTVLQAGTLELVLLNADAQAGRALVVQSLSHNGATLTPTDNDVVFDQGSGPAAFDGLDTVPGTRTLTTAGALRFSLPVSRVVAAAAIGVPDASTAAPGVYVDADRGDDANAGTFDRPWRSLAWPRRLAAGAGVYPALRQPVARVARARHRAVVRQQPGGRLRHRMRHAESDGVRRR